MLGSWLQRAIAIARRSGVRFGMKALARLQRRRVISRHKARANRREWRGRRRRRLASCHRHGLRATAVGHFGAGSAEAWPPVELKPLVGDRQLLDAGNFANRGRRKRFDILDAPRQLRGIVIADGITSYRPPAISEHASL